MRISCADWRGRWCARGIDVRCYEQLGVVASNLVRNEGETAVAVRSTISAASSRIWTSSSINNDRRLRHLLAEELRWSRTSW